jgi:flagellin
MAQIINTNIASLTTQRNLNRTQDQLSVSLQRLSSGLRINSAKDDAAGLAISERFTAQIRGLNQAVRNANDGISFAQTAEGALGTVSSSLQRIRELAVQAINDTNSASDRAALNNEVQQLIAEVNRVANTTQFNGQNILDGSLSELTFQVGANQNQTISVTGVDSRGSRMGADTETGEYVVLSDLTGAAGTALSINGTTVDTTGITGVNDLITAINAVANDSGVQAQKASTLDVELSFTALTGTNTDTITINGVDVTVAGGETVTDVVSTINGVSGQTGVTASVTAGGITFTSDNAADMTMDQSGTVLGTADAPTAGTPETYQAGILLSTEVGTGAASASIIATGVAEFGFDDLDNSAQRRILNDVNTLTGTDANDALLTVDFALQQVNGLRAELGAVQTRFESTIVNLQTTAENLTAARSRIQDADFASETAELTRAQILQQAGVAILAQANALPQLVLSLLQ